MSPQHYTFIDITENSSDETLVSLKNEDQLPAICLPDNDDTLPFIPSDHENESVDVNVNNDHNSSKESIVTTMGEGSTLKSNFIDKTSSVASPSEDVIQGSVCPSMEYIVDNIETFRKTISMLPIDIDIWYDKEHHKFNTYRMLLPVEKSEKDRFQKPKEYFNDILLQMLFNW